MEEGLDVRNIQLARLKTGIGGILPCYSETCAQAAAVCLEDQSHSPGVTLSVSGWCNEKFVVEWQPVSQSAFSTFEDDEEATEYGAQGIAIYLVDLITEFQVLSRAKKGGGFDFWLGNKGQVDDEELPFQNKVARMEVSGIRNGTDSIVAGRVKSKQKRKTLAPSNLATYVVVVEFGRPRTQVEMP